MHVSHVSCLQNVLLNSLIHDSHFRQVPRFERPATSPSRASFGGSDSADLELHPASHFVVCNLYSRLGRQLTAQVRIIPIGSWSTGDGFTSIDIYTSTSTGKIRKGLTGGVTGIQARTRSPALHIDVSAAPHKAHVICVFVPAQSGPLVHVSDRLTSQCVCVCVCVRVSDCLCVLNRHSASWPSASPTPQRRVCYCCSTPHTRTQRCVTHLLPCWM